MEPEIGSWIETRDRKVSTGRRDRPQFAAAHSGLADSYSILGYLSYPLSGRGISRSKAPRH